MPCLPVASLYMPTHGFLPSCPPCLICLAPLLPSACPATCALTPFAEEGTGQTGPGQGQDGDIWFRPPACPHHPHPTPYSLLPPSPIPPPSQWSSSLPSHSLGCLCATHPAFLPSLHRLRLVHCMHSMELPLFFLPFSLDTFALLPLVFCFYTYTLFVFLWWHLLSWVMLLPLWHLHSHLTPQHTQFTEHATRHFHLNFSHLLFVLLFYSAFFFFFILEDSLSVFILLDQFIFPGWAIKWRLPIAEPVLLQQEHCMVSALLFSLSLYFCFWPLMSLFLISQTGPCCCTCTHGRQGLLQQWTDRQTDSGAVASALHTTLPQPVTCPLPLPPQLASPFRLAIITTPPHSHLHTCARHTFHHPMPACCLVPLITTPTPPLPPCVGLCSSFYCPTHSHTYIGTWWLVGLLILGHGWWWRCWCGVGLDFSTPSLQPPPHPHHPTAIVCFYSPITPYHLTTATQKIGSDTTTTLCDDPTLLCPPQQQLWWHVAKIMGNMACALCFFPSPIPCHSFFFLMPTTFLFPWEGLDRRWFCMQTDSLPSVLS